MFGGKFDQGDLISGDLIYYVHWIDSEIGDVGWLTGFQVILETYKLILFLIPIRTMILMLFALCLWFFYSKDRFKGESESQL